MGFDVDQSGKIENTKLISVLAVAGKESKAIFVSRTTKRELIRTFKLSRSPKIVYLQLFSCCLYLLVKDLLSKSNLIVVDVEYVGKDELILNFLQQLALHDEVKIKAEIRFNRIGKKSLAHEKAIYTFRDDGKGATELKLASVLKEMRKIK